MKTLGLWSPKSELSFFLQGIVDDAVPVNVLTVRIIIGTTSST